MNESAISISSLIFSYDQVPILEQTKLEIPRGSFIGIIGPNGGGKTTFLKLIMGFLSPNEGDIHIFGKAPKSARTQIGYVPQVHKCDREFPITVLELVLLGALSAQSLFGSYSKETKKKALEIIEELGLSGHLHYTFGSLSGGLAQRALLARALLSDPKLLLLDEPTANVDPSSTKLIMEKLSHLKGNKTILIVTHDVKTIVERVDKVLCIQGEITSYLPQEICEHFACGLYHMPKIEGKSHANPILQR
jgi:zinc transport system ATP-binding protein